MATASLDVVLIDHRDAAAWRRAAERGTLPRVRCATPLRRPVTREQPLLHRAGQSVEAGPAGALRRTAGSVRLRRPGARSRERRVAGRVAGNLAIAPSRAHTLDGSPKID
jgi:hypothetical protein